MLARSALSSDDVYILDPLACFGTAPSSASLRHMVAWPATASSNVATHRRLNQSWR